MQSQSNPNPVNTIRTLCTRTQEKGTVTTQETCLWVSGSLRQRCGSWWPAAGLEALIVAIHAWTLLRDVTINFITSTIVWPQLNSREETQLHSSTENWIKDLLSMVLPIRTRPRIPLGQSIPSGSFHKPFIFLCQRTDRLKPTITED